MKFFLFSILLIAGALSGLKAQINYLSFFDKKNLRLLEIRDHLTLDSKWTMNGVDQAAMNEGLNSMIDGDLKKAKLSFTEVITRNKDFAPAYYYRGVASKHLLQADEARNDFRMAIQSNNKLKEAYIEYGELLQLIGDYRQAETLYESSVKIDKNFAEGYYHLGLLAQKKGELDKARTMYQRSNKVNASFAPAYVAQAIMKLQEKGDRSLSLPFFDNAIAADSSYHATYVWRGLALLALYENDRALVDWDRSVTYFPSYMFARIMHGYANVELKKFDDGFSDFRKALLDPQIDHNDFLGVQSALDTQIDLWAVASYIVRNANGLDEEPLFLLKKGFCLLFTGKQGSIDQLEASARMEPSASAYYALGFAFEQLHSHNLAINYYQKAIKLDPDIFDAHKKLSIYFSELKKWDQCFAEIDEMLRIQPGSIVAYRLRGFIQVTKNDCAKALADLIAVIAIDSSDLAALKNIAICKASLGEGDASNQILEKLLLKEPSNHNLYEMLVRNYLIMGDTAKAIATCKRALKATDVPAARLQLTRIYINQKKWDQASQEVDKVFHISETTSMIYTDFFSEGEFLRGWISDIKGAREQAIIYYDKSLLLKYDNYECRYRRAQAYRDTGRNAKAKEDLEFLTRAGYMDSEKLLAELP